MKKKIFIGAAIITVIAFFVVFSIMKNGNGAAAFGGGRAFGVKVKAIGKGEISTSISANGAVEGTEKAEIFFETPLRVVKVLAQNHQKVVKGQQLLELDMDALNTELDKLKLSRKTQEIALDTTAADAEIARAEGAVHNAERAYGDAAKNYEKNKALYEASAISKNELELSEKTLQETQTALKNAQVAYNAAVSGRNLDGRAKDQNIKAVDLSISELEGRISKVKESMKSPIDGVIAEANLREGSYTSNMQPAFVVIDPDKLQIKANVREYDIKFVQPGQSVKITGDAIDSEAVVTGRVESISPIAKVNRTTSGEETVIETIISIESSNAQLKPGLNVSCDIFTISRKDVLVAPMEMFDEDKDGNKFAYVIDSGTGTMKKAPVKLGISSDMAVEVLEGLKEGDLVILNPQPLYKDGARVRILAENEK